MARGARRQSKRPRERGPFAHPQGLSAAVASLRAMPESSLAVGATAADNRDFLLVEVCHGIVLRSALREDLASATLAGVGSFVRESLDLSGDESYSSHGRELLIGLLCFTQTWEKIAKGRFSERRARIERARCARALLRQPHLARQLDERLGALDYGDVHHFAVERGGASDYGRRLFERLYLSARAVYLLGGR